MLLSLKPLVMPIFGGGGPTAAVGAASSGAFARDLASAAALASAVALASACALAAAAPATSEADACSGLLLRAGVGGTKEPWPLVLGP